MAQENFGGITCYQLVTTPATDKGSLTESVSIP
jgi:hypothetical protein